MQKNQRCKASAMARGSVLCDDGLKVEELDDEPQLLSSTDQKSCPPDQQAVSGASSNSNSESMNAAQQSPRDTRGSDQGARRSLLGPAETRSRPHITKASVWFLRTTS